MRRSAKIRFPLHPPSSRVSRPTGDFRPRCTNNNAKQIGHEVGLRSHLDASRIETIRSPTLLRFGGHGPRNYGKLLAFNRLTIQGPNCPVPPWSRVVGEPRTPRGSFISMVIYDPRATL